MKKISLTFLRCTLFVFAFCCFATIFTNGQIDNVTCGSWEPQHCDSGGRIVIKGKNFANLSKVFTISTNPVVNITGVTVTESSISGTLQYGRTGEMVQGPYGFHIPSNLSDGTVFDGTLILGIVFGLQDYNWYYYPGLPPTDSEVYGEAGYKIIFEGQILNISGRFNTSKEYHVYFYGTLYQTDMETSIMTCENATVTHSLLSCIVSNVNNIEIIYRFLVKDVTANNFVVMNGTMPDLLAEGPFPTELPVVTGANGTCIDNSAYCTDGTNITLNGVNFAKYAPDGYQVNIENLTDGECLMFNTTETSLTCTLKGVNETKGMFVLTVQIRQSNGILKPTKRYVGTLIIGERKGQPGWTIDYIDPSQRSGGSSSSDDLSSSSSKTKAYTVTTALTIVFAILFGISLIVLIIVLVRFKLLSYKTWVAIEKQIQSSHVAELRPRAAVHVKNEPANY